MNNAKNNTDMGKNRANNSKIACISSESTVFIRAILQTVSSFSRASVHPPAPLQAFRLFGNQSEIGTRKNTECAESAKMQKNKGFSCSFVFISKRLDTLIV
jgi:hypothetical protein